MQGRIRIGTSGWSYDHWTGPFYPANLPAGERLAFYARRLSSAEINNSFYQLPSERSLRVWGETVPEGFCFAVKASRYITHMKKLKDPAAALESFLGRIALLGERLGPILFQLPPGWRFDSERLERFLDALSPEFRYAFELRDPRWLDDRALELLSRHRAAFCVYELDGFQSPMEVTTDFVYLRLHGPDGPYRGNYDAATLAGWAAAIEGWRSRGLDVFCYFDNDEAGYAVRNAMTLSSRFLGAHGKP